MAAPVAHTWLLCVHLLPTGTSLGPLLVSHHQGLSSCGGCSFHLIPFLTFFFFFFGASSAPIVLVQKLKAL